MPAEQGFETEHLAIDLGLRLVMQRQFVMGDRRAQIMLQRVAFSQMPVHLGVEEPHHMAAVGLGAVERRIGIGDQRVGVARIRGIDRGADAEADRDRLPPHLEGLGHRVEQALGQRLPGLWLVAGGQDERELVAADARDEGIFGSVLAAAGKWRKAARRR